MKRRRPNVLLLFTDQHRADVMGCEGHPDVETPALDRLAGRGTRFTRAYCQDGVCVPSRSSLFSGLYPRTLGCLDNDDRSRVMEEAVSLQSALRANGYATGAFGKRHLYLGCDEGWDRACGYGGDESAPNYFSWVVEQGYGDEFARDWAAEWGASHPRGPKGAERFRAAPLSAQVTELPDDMTMEAYTRRESLAFIRDQVEAGTPFFCWSSFYRPHQPYTPLRKHFDRFDRSRWGRGARAGDGIAKPPAFDQAPEALPPMLAGRRRARGLPWCLATAHEDEQLFRDAIAAYYACMAEIDDHIGLMTEELERLGVLEDTIVVYTSDHGEFAGAHGIMEKVAHGHNVYEETLRVPLIVSWPGRVRTGEASAELVELVDLYPTLLELSGCERPEGPHAPQGRSLAGHLRDGTPVGRRFAVSENWSRVSIVTDRYKLGRWLDPRVDPRRDWRAFGDMLFDREADPHELVDLAGRPDDGPVVRELLGLYEEWARRTPSAGKDAVADARFRGSPGRRARPRAGSSPVPGAPK
jgi:arylsulfatase A-like enzyme